MKFLLPTPEHVKLLELAHGYLRGAEILTVDGPKPIDKDDLARQINLYLNHQVMTHGPGCWAWGPTHYMCAYREIQELNETLSTANLHVEQGP
jgi:hypothetical protein